MTIMVEMRCEKESKLVAGCELLLKVGIYVRGY